jgi:hypothetical protein
VRSRLSRAREELRRMMEGKITQPRSHHPTRGEATPFMVGPVKGGSA